MNPTNPPIEVPRDPVVLNNFFVSMLQQFRDGESIAELSESLQTLVSAVRETEKKGELTYKIKVAFQAGEAVVITDEIKIKAPELDRDKAIFFATEEGLLQRENPHQRQLDLKEVHRPAQEVRDVRPPVAAPAAAVAS